MFLLLALLLLIFLPSPWNFIGALTCGALGVGEVVYWQRRMRRRKVVTGVENLVGATGEVTDTCAPRGRVRLQGELWEARSTQELSRGTPVRVVAVRDLTLDVEPTNGASGSNVNRAGLLAVVLVVALALAGCGGDDDESASESYANSVCTELSEWVTSIDDSIRSLTEGGLSTDQEDLEAAVAETTEATDELVDDLRELGPPDTEEGEQAKEELDSLATELRQQVDTIETAVDSDSGAAAFATTVSTAVSTATTAASSTFEDLEELDPSGELADAFENSDDCDSLRDQLAELGS
jgi:membrane protein implicated in regulation of membrane protease activity